MKSIRTAKKSLFGNSKRVNVQTISAKRKQAMIAAHTAREKAIESYSTSVFAFQFTPATVGKKKISSYKFKK